MKTKIQREARTIRETSANWESNSESGDVISTEISVHYYSPTVAMLKAQRIEAQRRYEQDPTAIVWVSEELEPMLHSLTGLPDGIDVPSPITIDWLDAQDIRNLTALRDAINQDMTAGKTQPAK
ncbi:MAG TPA: hypothetical protein PLN05_17120 [Pyrinomonadaceae bacterium]|nr:hypothetical protein [Chloracidobacterium sp.]HRJ89627.1 hypothetical protein [Pyrinomonadaceae bacterium]HRK52144.1 hypothetical protein [Pyrinomonadaceae bacterium]